MDDVRKAAQERAARAKTAPIGTSFETERQRSKNALVKQIKAQDGRNVHKIAAATETPEENRILRVAAYCRVSTDDIDQAISIHLQIQHYMKKIRENPNWKYVGCYVDDGFSGTNTDHRQGFRKLMKDAMDGKIDMIITKAVSRFARNLMDCIGWVEALQSHDPPVRVFFEQENLDTMSQTSGIILFVLAMVAQEESHMKSEATLLSLEWRFSRGRFLTPRLFGYDSVEVPDGFGGKKKVLSVNEDEARVVRWMYSSLLNGATPEEIAESLTDMAIPTGGRRRDGTLNTHWTGNSVVSIMRNEKHCGDVLARKTYTPNYKDHKSKRNNGKKNKYFQPDHHEAIISRAMWNAAQRILNSRKYGHDGSYLPMQIIDHGVLTGFISMNRAWAGFDFEDYYRAGQIAMGILDEDLDVDLEKEYLPEGGRRIGGLVDDHGIAQIARDLTAAEQEIPTSKTPISQKKIIPNSRTVSDRKKGGQPGHKKSSMAPFSDDEITDTQDHPIDCSCPCCGGALEHVRDITKDELDYEIRTVKKRHYFKEYVCAGCGHTVRSRDDSLRSENQYGPVIQTLALSLLDLGFVSINRTRKILSGMDPGSLSISDGYLSKLQKRYALKLRGFVDEVRQACITAPILYWDDTVIFVNTSRACFRFYGNERVALYCAHMKKDMDGILDDNVLPQLTESNTVMHDHNCINYYERFSFRNIECLQHLERDLQKTYNASKHQWAADMKELITGMIHKRKLLISSGADSFSDEELSAFRCSYDTLLHSGYKEYFKECLSHFSKDENALLLRLEQYRTNYTDWLYDFSLPTTNNLSERSLRFIKSKEKISGQFQNIEHAKYFAVIRTYIETCSRNGVNEFQALLRLAKGSPYSLKELNISHGGA